jgi:hypothetical protein
MDECVTPTNSDLDCIGERLVVSSVHQHAADVFELDECRHFDIRRDIDTQETHDLLLAGPRGEFDWYDSCIRGVLEVHDIQVKVQAQAVRSASPSM